MALRILITNNTLAGRAGTELYVRDVAIALLKRGFKPIAYSTILGEVAEELRRATVPVIDRLESLSTPPDLIHGHHHLETMTALLHFPGVPAIYFCHGWLPSEEAPAKFPRILRYVAVDETCRDRLLHEHAIPEARIRLLYNFVDLERFKPRSPLPEKPVRALVFSNAASENTMVPALREACRRANIAMDIVGGSAGNPTRQPEHILGNYDLVFAKGRAALEALAVGAAVVLCDAVGAGPMVTTTNMQKLRPLNCGIRALQNPIDADVLRAEISRYNAADAMQVCSWIRMTVGMDNVLNHLVALYHEVLTEHRQGPASDCASELQAASSYLRQWVPNLTVQHLERNQHELLRIKHERLREEFEQRSRAASQEKSDALDRLRCELDAFRGENEALQRERERLQADLTNVYRSPALRLRNHLVGIPLAGSLLRSCARFLAGSLR
ncbi:MAG: glycosyltransferase [Candidatus Binatia bacterium]